MAFLNPKSISLGELVAKLILFRLLGLVMETPRVLEVKRETPIQQTIVEFALVHDRGLSPKSGDEIRQGLPWQFVLQKLEPIFHREGV